MKKTNKVNTNTLDLISILIIISILTIVGVGSILVVYKSLKLKELSYFLIIMMPIELITFVIYKVKLKNFNKKEILIFLLFLFTGLSLLGSNNIKTSIWGFMNRYEGLLVCYSYYATALLASNIKDDYYRKIIIGFIIGIGLVNIIYGLFQTSIIPINIEVLDSWKYARGFQGNSMYFASLMTICYFLIVGLLLNREKKYDLLIYILLIITTIGNVISGSMALFCTSVFMYILLIIRELVGLKYNYFSKTRLIKIIGCIVLFIIISILFANKDQNYQRDFKTLSNEVGSVTKGEKVDNNFGTGRIYIWKNVLKKAKDNLVFGVGVDNFYYSFNPRLIDPISGFAVDKAHNDYLQRLLCEGVFSFICYIALLIMIIFNNIKTNDKMKQVLLIVFFAYITEIFFSISVIRVAPIYWILLGLLISDENTLKKKVK